MAEQSERTRRLEPAPADRQPPSTEGHSTMDTVVVAPTASRPSIAPSSDHAFDDAIDAEIIRLERIVATAGVVVAGSGFVLSLYIALGVARPLGVLLMGFSAVLVGWFVFVRACLKRGWGARLFQWVNPLLEISLPTGLVVIDALTQGAAYAIGQTAPLQFYVIFTCLAVLRLKPFTPLLVGCVGALEYYLAYAALIRPNLTADRMLETAFRGDMVLIRCALIVVAGMVGTLVSRALRSAANQAAGEVRSRELFGKYRMEAEIASGGMGVVYRATYCPEGGFRRPVALKRIHPHLAKLPGFVDKFRNEAELSSRLLHPNIVQVLDFGRVGDTYFSAMEYVDGLTLLELIERCSRADIDVPPRLVALIGRELCEGLAFAHSGARDDSGALLRVIHRDLSPPNVLVSRTGQVKILDFGVARALRETAQSLTGTVTGKLAYMAPEQVNGEPLDERCDLFAAAIIAWEVLCLRPLFNRSTDAATLMAVLAADTPDPRSLRADLAPGWQAFFVKGLARQREERFQSAGEMVAAFDVLLEAEGFPRPDEFAEFLRTLPEPVQTPGSTEA